MLTDIQVENILENQESVEKDFWAVFWLIILIILIVVFAFLMFVGGIKITDDKNQQQTFAYFALATILNIICNLLTSRVWENRKKKIQEKRETLNLKNLGAIADKNLMNYILKQINFYDGIFYREYSVRANLTPHHIPSLFNCTVEYEYTKKLTDQYLKFQIVRIRTDKDLRKHFADPASEVEFYWRSDERTFKNITVENNFYTIPFIQINQNSFHPIPEIKDNLIIYTVNIPSSLLNKEVQIHFKVNYVIENESFVTFIFAYPVLKLKCTFDYSSVAHLIDFSSYYFLNSEKDLGVLHNSDETIHRYESKDATWTLPKSNFLLAWYMK